VASRKFRSLQMAVVLGLAALVSVACAFPFWLESPTRRNPNDPKSPAKLASAVALPTVPPTPIATMSSTPTPVAAATPTPVFGPGTWVTDFEDNAHNDKTLPPFNVTINTGVDPFGSTLGCYPWTPSSGSNPGSTVSGFPSDLYCAHLVGTLTRSVAPNYPYAVIEMLLAPMGYGNGGGSINIDTKCGGTCAPHRRLIFDYRCGIPSTQYAVQIVTQNISDFGFYERAFSANDTNWHTEVVYFPEPAVTAPAYQKLAQSFGAVKPWRPDLVGEILIRVDAQFPISIPYQYDLSVDNVRFD
jgi:hypothetical protein